MEIEFTRIEPEERGASPRGAIQPRILVVDDDEMLRKLVQRTGLRYGWNVTLASDGLEAARLVMDTRWDVLLTDILMPGMDGVELIRLVRRRGPNTVIVATTGGGNFEVDYLHMAQLLGARLVLRKPFGLQELIDVMRVAIATSINTAATG
ncbi:MAG TPA: response regulator [Candidatus Didemnitutus sp.]|nr:response regulator [Candidatus Didemnitutus sp.]